METSIAVIIKTFGREKRLFTTLDSFIRYCDVSFRFYILDDGPISTSKASRYEKLKKDGHFVELRKERVSVTVARNYLVSRTTHEPYILRIDDDFEITVNTRVSHMVTILSENSQIGAIADLERQVGDGKGIQSGDISAKQGFLKIKDEKLFKYNRPVNYWNYQQVKGLRFAFCDFTRNFLLIKREVFEDVLWDENLHFDVEHEDFMLSLAKSKWKLAFTPESIHNHREDIVEEISNNDYSINKNDFKSDTDLKAYLLKKWNFTERVNKYPFLYLIKRRLKKYITQ